MALEGLSVITDLKGTSGLKGVASIAKGHM